MVVVPTFWAGLGVAAAPDANVHSVDWGSRALLEERVMDDQLAQGIFVDLPSAQRSVQATPTATVSKLQTQVDRRRDDIGCEDGVGEFEERVGAAIETLIQRIAEGV
jgi:hypothetical protein